jgi:hypothetical protein
MKKKFRVSRIAITSLIVLSVFLGLSENAQGQSVPYHHENEEVYEYLEELASIKVIQLNTAVLPLSRKSIYQLLTEAGQDTLKLNRRQREELRFYMQEFVKDGPDYRGLDYIGKGLQKKKVFPLRNRIKRHDLFHYKDSLFNITVNSTFGGEGWWTGGELYYERVVGAKLYGNISEYFTFYADIRDYHASTILSDETFLNQRLGANYKSNLDFSEMRGGIAVSTKWGYLGIVKDHLKWGSSYNGSNIFSGRTPSFPMIKLHLEPVKWFSFDYIHGWLVSDVLDSAASYQSGTISRDIMRPKFVAANMFTVRPIKGLHFSFGNSVVYSDKFNAVYLIPFLFYKSVDHTLNSTGPGNNARGQNSQMFINLVSRQIKYLHLYTSVFVDEIRLSTMFSPSRARNHISWKAGLRFTSPGNINASLIFEYTRNQPFSYRHFITTTTFESNSYSMGHYLRDNAEEFHVAVVYKPISRLLVNLSYDLIRKGETYPYTNGSDGSGISLIDKETLRRHQIQVKLGYQIGHDVKFGITYMYLKETGASAYELLPSQFSNGPHSLGLNLMVGI